MVGAVRVRLRRFAVSVVAAAVVIPVGVADPAPAAAADTTGTATYVIERPDLTWNNQEPEASAAADAWFTAAPNDGGRSVQFQVGNPTMGYTGMAYLAAPGETLQPGLYEPASDLASPDRTGASMLAEYSCREADWRGFRIWDIAWDSDNLARLALDAWCVGPESVYYQVRFNSDQPLKPLLTAPVRVDLPRTLVGQEVEQVVMVTGAGPGLVHPGTAVVTGEAAGDIAVARDGCAGTALEPGETCLITLRFRPQDGPGINRTAVLRIPSDSLAGHRSVVLKAPVTLPTTITITTSENPATLGNPPTFTATITPPLAANGDVAWTFDGVETAPGWAAAVSPSTLGRYTVSARYVGTEGYAPSVSNTITQTSYGESSITWTAWPSINAPEGVVDVFATAYTAGPGGSHPHGTLTITDETSGTVLGSTTGTGGTQLSVSLPRLSLPGLHLLTASYSGVAPWILPTEVPIIIDGTPSGDPLPVASLFAGGFSALDRAGSTGTVTVVALDARNGVVPDYRGTVHVASSDPDAILPADHTFTEADGGVWRFPVTLHTQGDQTVTITDVTTGDLVATGSVTVQPPFQAAELRPVDLSVGTEHACAVAADGVVECWGSAGDQTGDRRTGVHLAGAVDEPGSAGAMAPATSVAAGDRHTCAAAADGTVWCWGSNGYNQAPLDDTLPWDAPRPVSGVSDATEVSAGFGHSCARRNDGSVLCWGTVTADTAGGPPADVPGISGASAIASGWFHACAIVEGGSVRCWGAGEYGQLGNGATADAATPVVVTGITDATAIDADGSATCAVLATGRVMCWGRNDGGRLGDGTTTTRSAPVAVNGVTGAVDVAIGATHACAALEDGTVRCWGSNGRGQLGDGTTSASTGPVAPAVSGVLALDAGGATTCARLAGGISCWGDGELGQLGDGANREYAPVEPLGLGAGARLADHGPCALMPGGTVRCWGQVFGGFKANSYSWEYLPAPVEVPGIDTALALSADRGGACVVKADGTVWCWGHNGRGRLGDGTTVDRSLPVQVAGIGDAVDVALGGMHACAILEDTSAVCWGSNHNGEIGNGTTTINAPPTPPTPVTGLTGVIQLALGDGVSCARLVSGEVDCWGYDSNWQLGRATVGDPTLPAPVTSLDDAVDVSIGGRSACAVRRDGTAWCWGYGEDWVLGNHSQDWQRTPVQVIGVTEATGVTVSSQHACAVRADHEVWCWGLAAVSTLWNPPTRDPGTPFAVPGVEATRVVGAATTCVQRTDGRILCWGPGGDGAIGNGRRPYASRPGPVLWRTTRRVEPILEVPATAGTLTVPVILTVKGGDANAVHRCVDPTSRAPGGYWFPCYQLGAPDPTSVTFDPGDDERPVYGWITDERGAVLPAESATVRIDTAPPGTKGVLPPTTRVAEVPISITATDTGSGVAAWLVSDVPLTPRPSDSRWQATRPTSVVLTGSDGVHRVYAWTRDAAGNVSPPSGPKTLLDRLPPYGGGAPSVTLRTGSAASGIPVKVSWPAASDLQAGTLRYELQALRSGAAAYETLSLTDDTTTATAVTLRPGTYRFRVRAVDQAGNAGSWRTASATTTIRTIEDGASAISYGRSFRKTALSGSSGGTVHYSKSSGSAASLRTTARGIAFVSTTGPARGKAQVWLDGTRVATVDLYASVRGRARVVWSTTFKSTGVHTIRIVVTGTRRAASTSSRVDVDAFLILR